jgi:tetratricopeptide (TPR) repeat protein
VHLELAKIDDRIGLHNNSRPVAESLRNIEAAADLLSADEAHLAAEVQLAYGDYYYRAGMREREFSTATQHTSNAMEQFRAIGDFRGEADAVHRLGLIHLQQGELDRARELFDESLQLDREGGERVWFRGEYERHVGFLYQLSGDLEAALPHYERSLEARIAAQAIDASLFAALTLASAQLQLGNPVDARPHATYALCVAVNISSQEGAARAVRLLEEIDGDLPGNEYATELLDC